ncbi:uncharacterized protein LOC143881018 [Tasmannia lanceolata]|uniref:uncharacterized protein LOC143881018 n=1 Tax=Tasmannia lanceolata TaxID=3420 RepID=UPI004062E245
MTNPHALMVTPDRFNDAVMVVKQLGFDPLRTAFALAVTMMSVLRTSTWETKLEVFRSGGWSENEIFSAFKLLPTCVAKSEKKIRGVMDYFVNEMGWKPPSVISKHPYLFNLSLEKRIHPRCLVLKILMSKGLFKKDASLAWALKSTEKDFLEKFVIKNQEIVPELLRVYQSTIGGVGLDIGSEKLVGIQRLHGRRGGCSILPSHRPKASQMHPSEVRR